MYGEVYNITWLENWWNCPGRANFYACTGFIKEVAHFMGDQLGLSVVYVPPPANTGFGRFSNGSWSPGIFKEVRMSFYISTGLNE